MQDIPNFIFSIDEGLGEEFKPTRSTGGSVGWDVRSTERIVFIPKNFYKIDLGLRVLCPEGWWLELRPRSSTFGNKSLHSLYGVIDTDYHGKIKFACQYLPDHMNELVVEKGEAIAQLIPRRVELMNISLTSSEEFERLIKNNGNRGSGGFGSTG